MKIILNMLSNKFIYSLRFIKIFLKRYHKVLLALLGLILFSVYIWNRFLRTRNVKDLPLNLSIIGFFILLYIICIFIYIIISLLFPRNLNPIIEKIIDILFIPFRELDKSIKNISIIKKYYEQVLLYIFPLLEYLIIKTDLFYIIFWILPRLILLFVLFIDIFVYYKFEMRYKFVLIGLLLLFNRCFKYSLKNTKIQMIYTFEPLIRGIYTEYYPWVHPAELEPDYDPEEDDNDDPQSHMEIPLDVFIKHQTNCIVNKGITNSMFISHSTYFFDFFQRKYLGELMPDLRKMSPDEKENYRNKFGTYYEALDFFYNKREEFIKPKVEFILRISILLEHYKNTSNFDKKYKYLRIVIFTCYLICWLYVLIISYPQISEEEWKKLIDYLAKYKNILEQTWW